MRSAPFCCVFAHVVASGFRPVACDLGIALKTSSAPFSNWRISQSKFRERWVDRWTPSEVAAYQTCAGQLNDEQLDCHVQDLSRVFSVDRPLQILDVGSGAGTVCEILCRWISGASPRTLAAGGYGITALEPLPAMLELLKQRIASLPIPISAVRGFCDHPSDRALFEPGSFDLMISRQVTNGLYDPLNAFRNWAFWLKPGGTVIVMDGLFDRAGWGEGSDVDLFPLAATKSLSTVPYLLEYCGFEVSRVELMSVTNQHPTTKTPRYVVVADNSCK